MTNADYATLGIEARDGIATVTIANPPLNLLDAALMLDLDRFAGVVRTNENIRVIVFQSSDPDFFIAHGDMAFVDDPEAFAALPVALDEDERLNPMQRLFERLRKLPQVTIGKLSGYARGGGAELIMALDMRFAGRNNGKLAQMEAPTGIVPGAGGTVYLPMLVGRSRALEIILGADLFDAETAEIYGWINRAVDDNQLDDFVENLARRIARLAPGVITAAKAAIDDLAPSPLQALIVQGHYLGKTFARPAAADLTRAALHAGAQTREGEKELEALLHNLAG